MMLAISPKLTIIPVIMVPLSLLSAAGVMKSSGKHYEKQQQMLGQLNGYIEEMYNGQLIIQSFNYQERAKEQFSSLNKELQSSSYKAETTAGSVSPITTLVNDMGYVVCACLLYTSNVYSHPAQPGRRSRTGFRKNFSTARRIPK